MTRRSLATLALLTICASDALAQNFVYVNKGVSPNSIAAFSVSAGGFLSPVAGSPFLTGGSGDFAGYFASNRITACTVGNFLYASNDGSNSVSGFSINPATGGLTPIPGSPFPTGGSSAGFGISLAVTPDNQFLFAASGGSNNIASFRIGLNGALLAVPGSPFPAGDSPDGIKVNPNGRFLCVALPQGNGAVGVLSIAANGALSPVPGSPFPDGGPGSATGIDVDCAGQLVFAGEAVGGTALVDVFSQSSGGVLTPIPGSPFAIPGDNSNVVVLDPRDRFLFVSNQASNTICVMNVAVNGSLSPVPGTPFPSGPAPGQMATNVAGTFLYVNNIFDGGVGVFSIAANGAISQVPGSPFFVGTSYAPGIVAFPTKSCGACPHFEYPPTPAAGSTVTAQVGATTSFTVRASDENSGDVVGLGGTGLPSGSSFNSVPGNPVTGSFSWTPNLSDAGSHTISFGAFDNTARPCTVTTSVTIQVQCPSTNQGPAFQAPTPTCGSSVVAIVGILSSFTVRASDPDAGDIVRLAVSGLPAGASMSPALPTNGNPVSSLCTWTPGASDVGDHPVTFTITDLCGHERTCSITVRVVTDRPPDCSAALALVPEIWPPDKKLHTVSIVGVTDPDGDPVTVRATGVRQDEPLNSTGDGNTCPDATLADGVAQVRMERMGTNNNPGNGRVYTISFVAEDGRGASCEGSVTVCVPHSIEPGHFCVDDGLNVNSLGPCETPGGVQRHPVDEIALSLIESVGNTSTIGFSLPADGNALLAAYDVAGRRVVTLVDSRQDAGTHRVTWAASGLPQGIYYIRLRTADASLTRAVWVRR